MRSSRLRRFIMSYIVLLISVFVLATVQGKPSAFDNRHIVGGKEVSIEDYPYQVSVQFYGQHICTGSIISATSVLTAAHCIFTLNPIRYTIRAGSRKYSQGQLVGVDYVKPNELYYFKTYNNDIAILILNSRLLYGSTIQPIALPSYSTGYGSHAFVSGWGLLGEGGDGPVDYLRAVDVRIVNWETCYKNYPGRLTSRMMCASALGHDSCQADAGGPLKSGGVLVGVFSWGYGCADPEHPGVYADVWKLLPWINANM